MPRAIPSVHPSAAPIRSIIACCKLCVAMSRCMLQRCSIHRCIRSARTDRPRRTGAAARRAPARAAAPPLRRAAASPPHPRAPASQAARVPNPSPCLPAYRTAPRPTTAMRRGRAQTDDGTMACSASAVSTRSAIGPAHTYRRGVGSELPVVRAVDPHQNATGTQPPRNHPHALAYTKERNHAWRSNAAKAR